MSLKVERGGKKKNLWFFQLSPFILEIEKKKISNFFDFFFSIFCLILHIGPYDAYDASDQKHGFLKFGTCNFENGVKWSSASTLDDTPKKIPTFLAKILCF